jgi:FMN hydrolase / 5-amino-6-(5-phospho-D-ribitylamino)uracil phosphatase
MSIASRVSHIRAISFDGDMTLWDFEKVMRHSLAHALAEVQKHLPGQACADLTIERMIEIRNTVAGELKGKRLTLEQIRFEAFRRTLFSVGSNNDELAAYLNQVYLKHRFEDIEFYPDVLPTLDLLAGR